MDVFCNLRIEYIVKVDVWMMKSCAYFGILRICVCNRYVIGKDLVCYLG